MSTRTEEFRREIQTLADDARALLNATAGMAEEQIVETRKRLAAALETSRAAYGEVEEKAVEQGKLADEIIRANPYKTMGIAFGVGALIGLLLARKS